MAAGPSPGGLVPWSDAAVGPCTPAVLAFDLLPDGDYLESGTFIAYLPDGSVLFIQLVISSVGAFSHEPGVSVKHVRDLGSQREMAVKFSKKDIVLADDNCSLRLKDNAFIYNAATNSYHVVIPHQSGNTVGAIDLTFAPDGPSVMAGDGKVQVGDGGKFMRNVFPIPRATVTGTIQWIPEGAKKPAADAPVERIEARGFVSRLLQNVKAHKVATTWSLCKFDSDRATVVLVSFRTPPELGGGHVYLAFAIVDGEALMTTTNVTIEAAPLVKDAQTGYSVPEANRITLVGTTPTGESARLVLDWRPTNLIDKYDLLAAIPWLIRMVVKAFVAAPWCFRYYDPVTALVVVGAKDEVQIPGRALREFVFVNPEK